MFSKLQDEMKAQNVTAYKLAQITGMNTCTIYHALKYGPIYPRWRKKICDALGRTEEELFTPEERGEHSGRE